MKYFTPSEAETKRHQAVELLRRIGNDDAADDYDDMTPEEYAEHRGSELLDNPQDRRTQLMPTETKLDLQETLDQIGDMVTDALDPALSREEVIQKLQDIDDLVNGEDEAEEDDDDTDDDGDDDDEYVAGN